MRMKRAIVFSVLACIVLAALPACNTMRGIGKDIQRAGEKIQELTR